MRGCQLQHLAYEEQLKGKRDIVIQSLERHTRFDIGKMDIRPTIGMENPWHYRNKSQFQLGLSKNGKMVAGLYGLDSHRLVPITECIVQHPATNKTTQTVKQILEDFGISVYNERKRTGDVRTIVTRVGFETGKCRLSLSRQKKTCRARSSLQKKSKSVCLK